MTLNLPAEILSKIAYYLSLDEKIICSGVCRQWKGVFQLASWDRITINDRNICSFTKWDNTDFPQYKENGEHVKNIIMTNTGAFEEDGWKLIQFTFPYIRRIYFSYINLCNVLIDEPDFCLHWVFLKTVVLNMGFYYFSGRNKFFEILSGLPCLRRIKLVANQKDSSSLRMGTFESMQKHLPLLEYISLNARLSRANQTALLTAKDIILGNSVTEFKLTCPNININWLCYFTRKYLNVRKLKLKTYLVTPAHTTQDTTTPLSAVIPQKFAHLENAYISVRHNENNEQDLLWKSISPSSIPVRRLAYRQGAHDSPCDKPSTDSLQLWVDNCSKTIEYLDISSFWKLDGISHIPFNFQYCPHLVYLNLSARVSIKLDCLLDNCKALKKIKLKLSKIICDQNTSGSSLSHDVSTISLYFLDIGTEMLNYISCRCRKLRNLGFHTVNITGNLSEETGSLLIDLSYSHLKSLSFKNTLICLYSNPNEKYILHRTAICCPLYSHSNNQKLCDNISDKAAIATDDKEQFKENQKSMWTDRYITESGPESVRNMSRVIESENATITRPYHFNVQEGRNAKTSSEFKSAAGHIDDQTKKTDVCSLDDAEIICLRQVFKEDQKEDLCHGYVEFRLGSLRKFQYSITNVSNNLQV
ncbi:hypothetical protein J3Q64DRAFT_1743430 [Phycomyces blakesleeanus]|uniref:F-box domain-containing protein n=2 Tax=Phycomyces blakesleeanus TaxID=4837 RepID=A0A162U3L8_PHYB8|nr:hypothetical protein PHYBLDRAFT_168542 [Phycomyces blakesleeanus NRRL 1555(-)]OAD73192.1 hypothetical protein PHYBLDRAFT_168542 [Phycomyces blakesleeanus NRRL 1555(-)]|eukprot:XP_018291232.1 hypothetical protein PHYBLDRAFT_168542 [Phycomyces blakesleeanus NRRL 1555(-)]